MKPWEGKHFIELMERHQPFYRDDNSIDDVKIIEALKKDWEEQMQDLTPQGRAVLNMIMTKGKR